MKKNNEAVVRRIVPAAVLVCLTSFNAVCASLSFETYSISYNDETTQITTMSHISEDELLNMANLPHTVKITDISTEGNITTIEVDDSFPVKIIVDGKTSEALAVSDTVENVILDAGITLGKWDIVNLDRSEILLGEATLEITRVSKEYETLESEINYSTVRKASTNLDFGDTVVKSEGSNGLKLVTYEKILHDGVLIEENIVSEEVLKEATSEVLEYGPIDVNAGVTHTDGVITTSAGIELAYSKVIDVEATAYSTEGWTSKHTASGTLARVGAIAVDPRVIPLGSKLFITSPDGTSWIYGEAVAEDTGGAIKGNKIDLFFNTQQECINFGRKSAKVYVLS